MLSVELPRREKEICNLGCLSFVACAGAEGKKSNRDVDYRWPAFSFALFIVSFVCACAHHCYISLCVYIQ